MFGKNPDLRGAIISNTEGQAKKWMGQISANILTNPRYQEVFPDIRPEDRKGYKQVWHDTAIMLRRSERAALREKDPSLQALGIGKAFLGARLDFAILDDVLDWDNTRTKANREAVITWFFSTLLGRIVEGGYVWIIGTAWHEEDLAHVIEKTRPNFHVVRYQAGTPACAWPARWSAERLQAKLEELLELEYNRQLLNIAIGDSTGLLPIAAIRECQELCDDPPEYWVGQFPREKFRWVTAGVDLGASKSDTSARTAIFVEGMDRDGCKHVLHLRSGLWVGAEVLKEVLDVHRTHRPNEWSVETNAAQLHLQSLLRERAILEAIGASRDEVASLRVKGHYTTGNKFDTVWGIRGMGVSFDAHRWRIPKGRPEVEMWIDEMRRFSLVEHTGDRLIASWLADMLMAGKGQPLALKATSGG
jgi:hypothetical protein